MVTERGTPISDNVSVTAGSGTTVAADEVVDGTLGTVKVQMVKIMDATLDSTNKLVVDSSGQMSVKPNGNVAHDGADSGNPLKVGAKAVAAISTATMVSAADRTDAIADIDSISLVKPHCPYGDIVTERVTDTGGTSTAFTNFGATASARNMITTIVVYNDSTTNGFVDFRDGTGGAVILTLPLPAKGGSVFNPTLPLRQPTQNTALAYDVSAALSTVYISAIGFKSKL